MLAEVLDCRVGLSLLIKAGRGCAKDVTKTAAIVNANKYKAIR